jgi:hypothetical protein
MSAKVLSIVSLLVSSSAFAGQPPRALLDHSILVTWSGTETLEEILSGARSTFPDQYEVRVYVSEGLTVKFTQSWGSHLENTGSFQQVFDSNGNEISSTFSQLKIGKIGAIELAGNSLAMIKQFGNHGIQRLHIAFSSDYKSCIADFSEAFDTNRVTEWEGPATHKMFKRISMKVDRIDCSVRSGNM